MCAKRNLGVCATHETQESLTPCISSKGGSATIRVYFASFLQQFRSSFHGFFLFIISSSSSSSSQGFSVSSLLFKAMGNICVVVSDSHTHHKPELSDCEDTSTPSMQSSHGGLSFKKKFINLSSKRLISMKKTRYTPQAAGSLDSPVWQRGILMGERCEPPVFSGLILYDEYGNSVPDFPCKPSKSPVHPALGLVV